MGNIRKFLKFLPDIHKTIWFNFHYLPLRQAVKLPILLYKPKLLNCSGSVRIEAPIRTGMIRLGVFGVSVYPNRGITWENRGSVIFSGSCYIGNNSYIAIGGTGNLSFGDCFCATADFRVVCYKRISFGANTLVGWSNLFCDTDFHATKSTLPENVGGNPGYAPITIGENNWFAMKCTTLKGANTPPLCIVGAGSLLLKDYSECPPSCLIAGNPAKFIKGGIYHDRDDDKIKYE